ncbi:MAG: DUF3043 domain-containing protein [Actinophytocola sp.]|nr:DUF3043 domain-containing protein [Actinophytocola sp.]
MTWVFHLTPRPRGHHARLDLTSRAAGSRACHRLTNVRFLRRNSSSASDTTPADAADAGLDDESGPPPAYTPKKGRPTPSRREAEGRRRGPVAPPPKTTREAIKRSRELRKSNPVSKDERRAMAKERRERMMAGDDRYLLPRDRGPIKAFVRDCVDARHNLLGLFMPLAIVVFASLLVPLAAVQQWATLLTMAMLLVMVVEAVLNGRRIAQLARKTFPDEADKIKARSIGWYAFIRASQIRRLRVPKPRVKAGDPVKVK